MSNSPHRNPVEELADQFAARYRRGERPSISEYSRQFPEHAAEIEEVFPALVMMEQVDSDLKHAAEADAPAADPVPALSQLGDFRIIREVARGGMGVVYEAEQVSLGRRVALKVLPRQILLDSKHAKRFEREARAAAKLHHTNIVPVFGVGQQDGLHYYVMQFIHGLGLDEVLVELKRLREHSIPASGGRKPTEPAPIGVQASACVGPPEGWTPTHNDVSAVAVANSLLSGRFERTVVVDSDSGGTDQASPSTLDPRPSTLVPTTIGHLSDTFPLPGQSEHSSKAHSRSAYWQSVARIGVQAAEALQYAHDQGVIHRDVKPGNLLLDTRGCVWVTDFGLAKAADQQDLTHTGDVLGTLRYMAPEQFDGRADARSDVYSLGLTLYELLALQPGFDETERHKLVKQVTTGVPARLRTLDRHVPRDLETIVHKALDREPAHRYQTAGELAADLRRYLGDEPIHARRPPLLQRLAKWGRRHRAVIATAGVCLLVGTALLGGTIGWAVRDRAAERAERQAEAERERTARQARVTAQAQLFLADVERLAKEEQWDDALAAANRADAVLAVGEARHAMHENVRQAVKELETVRRLEQIWMERAALRDGDFDHAATVDAYARAFREFGVHVETLPTDAALTRLGAHRRIALPLAAALDQWAEARLNVFGRDDSGARSLVALARRLDPDPLRDRLRLSWCEKVTPELQSELQALAESIDFRREAPQTLNWLAISLAEAGLDELEERVLRQAQQAHPGDVWLNMHLGSFLRERKNYDEAIRFYSAAVGARPTFPAAHTNLGNALRDKGLADEAIAAYREAIRLQPDFAVAHSNLGILLHRKGLTDEAITAYQEAIRHQPDYALAHTNLGIALYYKKGLTDEAIAAFQEAIRDEPDFAVAHRELGSTYFQLSQFDKAISSFRKAVEFDPRDASAHNELSCAYYVLGRYDEAVACCRKAIELDPKFASAHSNLGNVLSKQGKLDDAIACHRKAIELDPHYARPYANLGRDYAKQGNLDEAVDYHRKAIALDPKDASFHSSLGAILSDIKQDYDGAVAAFREAVRLQPEDANAHTNLGNALSKKGLTDEAITACREAIRLQPEHATAHNNLGHALSKQGLTDEAIATYREAIRLQPGYTLAHNNLGHALSKQGLTVEAIAAYTSAIECNPRFASSHNSLAWLLATCPDLKFRNPARAVELGKRAVELSPQEAGVWNTLGVAHYRAGEWQAAIEALEKSMELRTGGDGFDWFFLAMAHWQQGHPDEARQWHDRAVEWMEANQPDDMELRRYRAEAAALLGIADPPPPQEPPI